MVAADAVAEGDLSHRVPVPNPRTEVGHLGVAFNTMVDRIEASFAERDELEQRLRRFVADAVPRAAHAAHLDPRLRRAVPRVVRPTTPISSRWPCAASRTRPSRMGVLVDDLLLLARLDQGRPLQRDPVELVALVDDAVADARAVEPDRPITFSGPGPGERVVVSGDDVRLHQVVANLLSNARVHTPERHARGGAGERRRARRRASRWPTRAPA